MSSRDKSAARSSASPAKAASLALPGAKAGANGGPDEEDVGASVLIPWINQELHLTIDSEIPIIALGSCLSRDQLVSVVDRLKCQAKAWNKPGSSPCRPPGRSSNKASMVAYIVQSIYGYPQLVQLLRQELRNGGRRKDAGAAATAAAAAAATASPITAAAAAAVTRGVTRPASVSAAGSGSVPGPGSAARSVTSATSSSRRKRQRRSGTNESKTAPGAATASASASTSAAAAAAAAATSSTSAASNQLQLQWQHRLVAAPASAAAYRQEAMQEQLRQILAAHANGVPITSRSLQLFRSNISGADGTQMVQAQPYINTFAAPRPPTLPPPPPPLPPMVDFFHYTPSSGSTGYTTGASSTAPTSPEDLIVSEIMQMGGFQPGEEQQVKELIQQCQRKKDEDEKLRLELELENSGNHSSADDDGRVNSNDVHTAAAAASASTTTTASRITVTADEVAMFIISQREMEQDMEEAKLEDAVRQASEPERELNAERKKQNFEKRCAEATTYEQLADIFRESWILHGLTSTLINQIMTKKRDKLIEILKLEFQSRTWYGRHVPAHYFRSLCDRLKQNNNSSGSRSASSTSYDWLDAEHMTIQHGLSSLSQQTERGLPKIFVNACPAGRGSNDDDDEVIIIE